MEQIIGRQIGVAAQEILKIKLELLLVKQVKQIIGLKIIEEINWTQNNINIKDLRKEAKELLALFTSIENKL